MGEATKAVKAVSGYPMPDYFLVRAQVGEPKKSRGYFERRSPFVLDTGFTEPNERTSRAPMKLMDSPSIRWEKNYAARLRRRASSRASSSLSASGSCSPPE